MKKELLLFNCLTVLLLLLGTQCTVEKRRYMKGFYVSSLKKSHQVQQVHNRIVRLAKSEVKNSQVISQPDRDLLKHIISPPTACASEKKNIPQKKYVVKRLCLPPDSCGDVITFNNGDELKVKLVEISPDYIAYRRCDNLTGPLIKANPDKVFRIVYSNGLVRVFKHEQPIQQRQIYPVTKPAVVRKNNGFAVASFICAMISWILIPAPFAFVFGIIGQEQIKNNPDKYKGKWMAVVGAIVGGITTAIIIIALIV